MKQNDWMKKHGFGPGTDVCARCKGEKQTARRRSKWCAKCDREMGKRRATGALDPSESGNRVVRASRIIR